ncbi:MAG: type II toxin-antitoxin system prevent-host-death family antitoxin [Puniceicoccales bacterium]|jgi:prevent-host-death family protein|nr:type II toxin-antitoxin system prevent-host-death family antitoxin [Puniceicoccales bacterium]
MINVCATNLRRDFLKTIKQVTDFDAVRIVSRNGKNFVIMTENEYDSLIETLRILSNSIERGKILHPDRTDCPIFDTISDMVSHIENHPS